MVVKFTRTVSIGGRTRKLREQEKLITGLTTASVEAAGHALKILAQETRELIVDRLLAANGRRRVKRPDPLARTDIKIADAVPYKHTPLAKSTVKKKKKANLDGRILVATGQLIYAFDVEQVKRGKATGYTVVIRGFNKYKGRRIHNATLAKIHEYGSVSAKIPARPFMRPAADDLIEFFNSMKFRHFLKAEGLRRVLRGQE